VNDAATLVSQKGDGAFKELMTNGSRWRTGDTYMFVCDLKGNVYVHEDPSLVGKNLSDLKDKNGKPIIQWFIKTASGPGQSGWTHYVWTRPGKAEPSWKSTYVKLAKTASGMAYVVGSGLYDMKMEKEFAIEAVNDAMALIGNTGRAAFPILRNTASEFVYKDTYVFVMDLSCNMLVHPASPELEGKNLRDMKDPAGKFLFREFVQVVQEHGSGWVDYLWPKPGTTKPVPKTSFVSKVVVKGETFVVGTGIYLE
jgi:signal transduction histidine kinase